MRLEVKRAADEKLIYKKELWRGFHPRPILDRRDESRECAVPVSRRCIATLFFEGELVAQTVLDVYKE